VAAVEGAEVVVEVVEVPDLKDEVAIISNQRITHSRSSNMEAVKDEDEIKSSDLVHCQIRTKAMSII